MPSTKRFKPDVLYRAIETVSFVDDEGVPQALTPSTILQGRHKWVQKFPQYFAPEGDPQAQAEARAALVDVEAEKAAHRRAKENGVTLYETKLRAKRAVKVDIDGERRSVRKGAVLSPDDFLATIVPGAFEQISVKIERS